MYIIFLCFCLPADQTLYALVTQWLCSIDVRSTHQVISRHGNRVLSAGVCWYRESSVGRCRPMLATISTGVLVNIISVVSVSVLLFWDFCPSEGPVTLAFLGTISFNGLAYICSSGWSKSVQMFCVELNLQMQICPTASCLHTVRVKNCKRRKVFRELWDSSQWYKYVFCLSSEPPETVTDCELKARILSVNFASEFLYWHEGCTILTTKGWGAVNSK